MIIGSHVSFKKDKQLVGSVEEALSYGSTTKHNSFRSCKANK